MKPGDEQFSEAGFEKAYVARRSFRVQALHASSAIESVCTPSPSSQSRAPRQSAGDSAERR